MGFLELFFVGVGLSMDAFSVAVCKGLQMRRIRWGRTLTVALFFGGFQALMPLIGWLLGKQFEQYITAVDHWIAFGLLLFIGGKMLLDVYRESREAKNPCEQENDGRDAPFRIGELALMALATSIDALAVGITFAFLKVNIWGAISIIGVTTFFLSIVGVFIGNIFGTKYQNKATIAGGVVLIIIGTKILIEHLFFS
ncbi:MAG: manganese efflux pump [Clostridia bacterium]|nr:manganese efflux pump [Clostridia bacterium]